MNYLVDPHNVVDFNRSDGDQQLFWLFCCVVAGKTATTQARLLNAFLSPLPGDNPFEKLRQIPNMLEAVKASRLGQYTRLARMFTESVSLDLRHCTVVDLEAIHGCGPKTARMFLMMSRPNMRHAALDTHILKYLSSRGVVAPKATPPSGTRYLTLEKKFLDFADESGMTVADFDLSIWKHYTKSPKV